MDFQSRVREEFARQAETLSVATAFTDANVLDRIRAATGPTKTMGILDVGCGPGILAAALAPQVREVVAFDLTPEMLDNALEILRDLFHVRRLSASEIQRLIEEAGLQVTATSTWEMSRDFEEWIRITNAPERSTPLFSIMPTLAKAGIDAGIDLGFYGKTVVFKHRWLLITAGKKKRCPHLRPGPRLRDSS